MAADNNDPIPLLQNGNRPPAPPQPALVGAGAGSPLNPVEYQLVEALNAAKFLDLSTLRAAIEDLAREGDDAEALDQHDKLAGIMADLRALDDVLAEDISKMKW